MDYEKKYKEALATAKDLLHIKNVTNYGLDIDLLYSIFPELEENEDEKAKRIILALPFNHEEDYIFVKKWLEKQGTPAKLSDEEKKSFVKGVLSNCALSFIEYLDVHKYEGKMCVSNGECEDIDYAFHNSMWDRLHRYYCKYIENQGEQKPFDYESANIQQKDFASVGETATIELSSPIDCGDRIYHVSHKPIEKNGEQKQEWSEEDKRMCQETIDWFEKKCFPYALEEENPARESIKWLKSLKDRIICKNTI